MEPGKRTGNGPARWCGRGQYSIPASQPVFLPVGPTANIILLIIVSIEARRKGGRVA